MPSPGRCWIIKSGVECILLPLTYAICSALKAAERVDAYDTRTDFNPFIVGN